MNSKKIKVAHITEAWAGGISTYVEALIDYQSSSPEFVKPHHIYASNRTAKIKSTNAELHLYESSRNPIKIFKIVRTINNIIKKSDPDIIHLHSTFPGVYGRLFRSKNSHGRKIQIVYCAHGWAFNQGKNFLARLIYAFAEKILAWKTDAIINISQHEADIAKKAGVLAKYNYIVVSGVRDQNLTGNAPIKINNDFINLGFIGRLDYKKGFDILVEAMSRVNRSDIKLYVIGGNDREKMSELPQNKKFHYLGWVDNTLIDDYINQFDALIIPSRHEGLGLIALEAMRNAKPVMVSDRGALPELVKDNFNGKIFSLDKVDELTSLLETLDKKRLLMMGKNARTLFEEKFQIKRQNEEITRIYQNLIRT